MARPSVSERFWIKVAKTDTCWLWMAVISGNNSYGAFRFNGRMQPSHRVAWTLQHGDIPTGICVLHRCDTPRCVNPSHLFLGTHADNMADKAAKGRSSKMKGSTHGMSKLTEINVISIRNDHRTYRQIAADFGVDQSLIGHIKSRRIWQHVP